AARQHSQQRMGAGAVLSLHLPELSDGRLCGDRHQRADGRGTDPLPRRRSRAVPVAAGRLEAHMAEGDQRGPARSQGGFVSRRRGILLLTTGCRLRRRGGGPGARWTIMSDWVRWTSPAAAVVAAAAPAYAVVYMSVGAAQKAAFPAATSFVEYDGRSWKAMAG